MSNEISIEDLFDPQLTQAQLAALAYGDAHPVSLTESAVAMQVTTPLLATMHVWPAEQSVDVPFHQFMADDLATAERILAKAGLPMTDPSRQAVAEYVASHPRGKEGRMVYHLERDFGVDPDVLRKRFAFYFDAFPVKAEINERRDSAEPFGWTKGMAMTTMQVARIHGPDDVRLDDVTVPDPDSNDMIARAASRADKERA